MSVRTIYKAFAHSLHKYYYLCQTSAFLSNSLTLARCILACVLIPITNNITNRK